MSVMTHADERLLGRRFAQAWHDDTGGLKLHPITAGYQLTIMKFFADAGRLSGLQGWSDEQHHAFVLGCRQGLRERDLLG